MSLLKKSEKYNIPTWELSRGFNDGKMFINISPVKDGHVVFEFPITKESEANALLKILNDGNVLPHVKDSALTCPICARSSMLPHEDAWKQRCELLEEQNVELRKRVRIRKAREKKKLFKPLDLDSPAKGLL